jgi:hypothetical protein
MEDKTDLPKEGKTRLIDRIKSSVWFWNCSAFAGVRPTVKDRETIGGNPSKL